MDFVTIEAVPIVGTGTYQLASGETTFSVEDLADAVKAAQDPTVPAPRIKIGHTDSRFADAMASGELDGEPAFGTLTNLRLSDDGQEIVGDLVNVPKWLADSMPSSYPGRSIEGGFGFEAPSGRTYRLVICALSLLGVTWPGVTSLPDLQEVLEQNGAVADTEPVAAKSDRFVVARITRPGEDAPADESSDATEVAAGLDLGNATRQFCEDLDDGEVPTLEDTGPQMWWWLRSVRVEDDGSLCLIVDDDEGHLIRIPFTVNQADLIYGTPELVIEQYVPVTSDPDSGVVAGRGPRVLASWPIRAASRPSTTTEVTTMDVDLAVLRKRLGLAEDADEAAISEALSANPEVEASTEKPAVPEGMVLVDKDTFEQVREGAEAGRTVAAKLADDERDRTITAAIKDGKFPVSRREHYEKLWKADPDGTAKLLTAKADEGGIAKGLVPVGPEIGVGGSGEDEPQAVEAEHEQFMARHFPARGQRANNSDRRVRVRTEA